MTESFLNDKVILHCGDCLDVLATIEPDSIDACVTDPPYHLTSIVKRYAKGDAKTENSIKLHGTQAVSPYMRGAKGFMGKQWDGGEIAFEPETWAAVLRVLKPGGHLLAFGAPKNFGFMQYAITQAGFEVRDTLCWLFGSGFPKSHDVSKAIDRVAGAERTEAIGKSRRHGGGIVGNGSSYEVSPEVPTLYAPATDSARQWQGWGTALKPAYEPVIMARKPLIGTVAENVIQFGTGAINVDGCRIHTKDSAGYEYTKPRWKPGATLEKTGGGWNNESGIEYSGRTKDGRWPANVIHDGSDEVVGAFPTNVEGKDNFKHSATSIFGSKTKANEYNGDSQSSWGSAARFFYSAKADADDRLGSKHPTVKPLDLMQYLVRLVTPPGGTVLDLFAGTGTTGEAAWREGFRAILIEREAEYQADIRRRMAHALAGPDERKRAIAKAKHGDEPFTEGLFA
jgi:DNA modification methylase